MQTVKPDMRFTQLWFRALVQTLYPGKGGRINGTNYPYSIISPPPPILVAKRNLISKKGSVISSEYGMLRVSVIFTHAYDP